MKNALTMTGYLVVILIFAGLIWLIVRENKRMRNRTPEEYERDVADPKLETIRTALSPFEFLKKKQAQRPTKCG